MKVLQSCSWNSAPITWSVYTDWSPVEHLFVQKNRTCECFTSPTNEQQTMWVCERCTPSIEPEKFCTCTCQIELCAEEIHSIAKGQGFPDAQLFLAKDLVKNMVNRILS